MNLVYWTAANIGDSDCYSIIAKTKKEAVRLRNENPSMYEPVVKRELVYRDAFDLFEYVTSEGGGRRCGNLV